MAGGVDPVRVDGRGKLVTYREPSTLHVYAAPHRRWLTHNISATAPVRMMNDCLLIQETGTWTAFSSYTGAFAAIAVGPGAQLVNPTTQNNDSLLLVMDGTSLHAFSCFTGRWVTRSVNSSTGFSVQRHVALLVDGTLISGLDAYTGTWTDTTVTNPPITLSCDGSAGIAIGPQFVHGFSANHRTWVTHTLPPGHATTRSDDWMLLWNATELLGYSSLRGTFASFPVGATGVVVTRDLFGIVDSTVGLIAFSAPRATFTPALGYATAMIRAGAGTAVIVDGSQATGYSAALGRSSTIPIAASAESAAAVIGVAVESGTGRPWCYSGLRDTWHPAPLDTLPGLPELTATAVLLPATSGAYAFSARSGNFVPLPGNGIALLGNDQSAVAAAWDATHLHAFDPRTDSWRTRPRASSTPPIVQLWRTSMFVIEGGQAHGFGAQEAVWSTIPLPSPYLFGRANSESGRIATSGALLAYSPVPGTMTYAQFPEFRRVQPDGTTAHFSIALAGGGAAVLAGGVLDTSPTPVLGLGDFWLTNALATVLLFSPTGAERATHQFDVPADPALSGTQLGFQALALPTQGSPHIGTATGLYIL
ncbi:MAG: hypothetical protein NXI31_10095 [bacterium]|nr:hypothetical protein [bacterium]